MNQQKVDLQFRHQIIDFPFPYHNGRIVSSTLKILNPPVSSLISALSPVSFYSNHPYPYRIVSCI